MDKGGWLTARESPDTEWSIQVSVLLDEDQTNFEMDQFRTSETKGQIGLFY